MNKVKPKAVVIGTGVGGAAAAALFSNTYDVTVLEQNAMVGGRTAMTKRDGFVVDIAVHTCPRGDKGPFGEIARMVSVNHHFIRQKNPAGSLYYEGRVGPLHSSRNPIDLFNILRTLKPSLRALPGASCLLLKIFKTKSIDELHALRDISAKDFIRRYTKDPDIGAFLEAISGFMLVTSAEKASAAEFIIALSEWFRQDSVSYPKGGFGQIIHHYLAVVGGNKGRTHVGVAATGISVENGRVTGVKTANAFYPADIVICNAGLKKTVELAGEQHFPTSYVADCKTLEDSMGGIVIQFGLDYQPMPTLVGMYLPKGLSLGDMARKHQRGEVSAENMLYLVAPTNADPSLAPPGQHILLVGGIVPEDCRDKAFNDAMFDMYEQQLNRLFPDFSSHVTWRAKRSIQFFQSMSGRDNGNAIGAGQHIGQSGGVRAKTTTPIKGLYVVGADTGDVGIGTELAAQSALNAFAEHMKG